MAGKQRKKKKKEIENTKEDRLSELPDCLLHHILSFSDAADAVKTCILSHRWRYLWISVPSLNFNFKKFSRVISSEESSFIHFINQLLLRRNSIPIHTFYFSAPFRVEAGAVESWIYYAVKHQVQHLTVEADSSAMAIQMPICFYGCTSLTTLKLCCSAYGTIKLPTSFDLPSLKNLHLRAFGFYDDKNIFSTCPNLETLKLEYILVRVRNFNVCALNLKSFDFVYSRAVMVSSNCEIVIVAPKLKKFKFDSYPPKLLSFKDLSSLDQIEINLPRITKQDYFYPIRVLNMLNSFQIAKTMTLSKSVIQVLSYIPTSLNEHPSQLSNLMYLKVKSSSKSSKKVRIPRDILNYFLKSSPLLQIC